MPVYLDRQNVSKKITAETIAARYQEDVKIQSRFNCKVLTYWFDDTRNKAFCLVKAKCKQDLINMRNYAHGNVPHQIVEIDEQIIESFLGRIEHPQSTDDGQKIIDDHTFRTVMITGLEPIFCRSKEFTDKNHAVVSYHQQTLNLIKEFNGRMVRHSPDYYQVLFDNATSALNCAFHIHTGYKKWQSQFQVDNFIFKTGLSANVIQHKKYLNVEDSIKLAKRMFYISKNKIIGSSGVDIGYKNENINPLIDLKMAKMLSPKEERFLNLIIDYVEKSLKKSDLHVNDLAKQSGFSKSQLYRKMIELTGNSPNIFLKEFRLNKAVSHFKRQLGNISEVAFETGFSSPSYFTKCFHKRFGMKPSEYINTLRD